MQIPLDKAWKLLGPRITTLITTINEKGEINAAPYSFVGSMSFNPPLIWVGFMENQVRHTFDNIKETKEFVINVVSEDFVQEAIECGKINERCNELERMNLEWEDSEIVKVPRIKKAKIVLECKYRQELDIRGSHRIIIGEIIKAIAEDVNEIFNPSQEKMKTIFHANGPDFYKIGKHIKLNWGKKK